MGMRHIIKISLYFLLLCIITTAVFGCNSSSAQTLPSQVATVQRGDLRVEVTASGNLALSETIDLAFDVDGIVEKVLIEEGDLITKGQILAQLDTFGSAVNYRPTNQAGNRSTASRTVVPWNNQKRNLELAVSQAKVNLNTALIDLKNTKNPQGTNAAPDPLNVESKEYKLKLAEVALTNAQTELERFLQTSPEIKAPFDGFVTKVNVKGGDVVSKGTVAVSIAAKDKFETTILVSEMDIRRVQIGMPATVQVSAVNGTVFSAKVTAISPTAIIRSGVVNYQVAVELLSPQEMAPLFVKNDPYETFSGVSTQANSNQKPSGMVQMAQLRDGLTATTKILIEEKKDVVLIVSRTIINDGPKTLVQVVKNGSTERRPVTIGSSNAQVTEVTKGLNEGEQVLIQQPQKTASPSTARISPRGDILIR